MSVKINKNGKEYDLGFVPQSLYDDVEDLKEELDSLSANDVAYDNNTTVKQKIDGLNDRVNTIKIYSQFRNASSTGSITVGISYWSRYGILLFGNGNGSSLVGVIQIEDASAGYVRSKVKATQDGTVLTLNVTKNSDNTITISNLPSWGWYGLVSPYSIS